jgi:hypothetical protein
MNRPTRVLALLTLGSIPAAAGAQPLGTFRWQLQPYCNVVTLAVTRTGDLYRLEGFDDQCGAPQQGGAVGTAFANPDGSIGLGFTVVTTPGGTPVPVDAAIHLSTLSGTWRDGLGQSGAFVFTTGAGTGGTVRPTAPAGTPVTTAAIGPGLTGSTATGTLMMAVDFGGSGTAAEVARADHTHGVPPSGNTALGEGALEAMRRMAEAPSGNTAVGNAALSFNTEGYENTAIGIDALRANVSGAQNVAIGAAAMLGSATGSRNTAIGPLAVGGGSDNVAIGRNALRATTTGSSNVAIGYRALEQITTGSGNIAIGTLAGAEAGAGQVDNIFVASRGQPPDNFTIRIGDAGHVATFIGGIAGRVTTSDVPVLINASGKLGSTTSSLRFKEQVRPLADEDDQLEALRPVQFTYRPEFGGDGHEVQYGLLAEEVAITFPELVARDQGGQPWAIRYQLLTPLILRSTQRLELRRRRLEERLEQLELRLDTLAPAGAPASGKEERR